MNGGFSPNAEFRRYYVAHLLRRLGASLPQLLQGIELIKEGRCIEQLLWRELGLGYKPIFYGDLPVFMMVDGDGHPVALSIPTDPVELAGRLAALEQSPPPADSCIGTNLDTLARLLNFTRFESQWLKWAYCVRCYGRAILPVVRLRGVTHGCEVLALLASMPMDTVQEVVASRRLYAWGFLDGRGTDGGMPSLLSDWLSATDQFADWIERPYASDSELLTALFHTQVSLPASR